MGCGHETQVFSILPGGERGGSAGRAAMETRGSLGGGDTFPEVSGPGGGAG